jgi:hypothetical protein
MRRITQELEDEFIDMFAFTNAPLRPHLQYMCDDGYHPCDFGHAEIADRAYPALLRAITS